MLNVHELLRMSGTGDGFPIFMLPKVEILIDEATARNVIAKYAEAWVTRNPEAILEVFTPDAVYQEWAFDPPFVGHEAIREYWLRRVVGEQSEIEFTLLDLYVDSNRNTVIAEWEAKFRINNSAAKNIMKEVAILEFSNERICHLREYWANKPLT